MNYAWRDEASCWGCENPDIFFPADGRQAVKAAIKICVSCKVRQDCLDFSMARNERGIWGGMTESQRKRVQADLPSSQKERAERSRQRRAEMTPEQLVKHIERFSKPRIKCALGCTCGRHDRGSKNG